MKFILLGILSLITLACISTTHEFSDEAVKRYELSISNHEKYSKISTPSSWVEGIQWNFIYLKNGNKIVENIIVSPTTENTFNPQLDSPQSWKKLSIISKLVVDKNIKGFHKIPSYKTEGAILTFSMAANISHTPYVYGYFVDNGFIGELHNNPYGCSTKSCEDTSSIIVIGVPLVRNPDRTDK